VQDNGGAIEDFLVANARLLNLHPDVIGAELARWGQASQELAASVKEGLALSTRVGPELLNIPVNAPASGGLLFLEDTPVVTQVGSLRLSVIGPTRQALEKLRAEWNDWLAANQQAVAQVRAEAEQDARQFSLMDEGQLALSSLLANAHALGDRNLVTTPNLASLMLLVEEAGRRLLLTGDGHGDDVLEGLRRMGALDSSGSIHVDLLKVQHHGSENNLDEQFCRRVTADHYLFCANGAHENPDLNALQAILDARLGPNPAGPPQPFKFWFNSSSRVVQVESRRLHMLRVEDFVRTAARASRGRLRRRFLTQGSKYVIDA